MISFRTEDIKFSLKQKTVIKNWIIAVIKKKKRIPGELSFIFCSDAYLLGINQQYLNHNTYTDIITFDYSKESKALPISGDIFISVERVRENATKYSTTFENELNRILIHGILHLLGHKDKTKADKDEMTRQENSCLRMLQQAKVR
ncbi:MAG: rRNA maturation RNase YbeY [Bacteroidia bacterium]